MFLSFELFNDLSGGTMLRKLNCKFQKFIP